MGELEQMPDIATLWAEVMTWLAEHAPVTAAALQGNGFTRDVVDAAAQDTGLDWPEDLRVWFTLHEGGGDELMLGGQLFPMFIPDELVESRFNRAQAISIGRQLMANAPGLIGDDGGSLAGQDVLMFLPEFIPVATDPGEGHLVVDLRPGPMHGCVTQFRYDSGTAYGGDEDEGFSWPSLTALVSAVRDALVEGAAFMHSTATVREGALWWGLDDDESGVFVADLDLRLSTRFDTTSPLPWGDAQPGFLDTPTARLPPPPPGWEGDWPPSDWDVSGQPPLTIGWGAGADSDAYVAMGPASGAGMFRVFVGSPGDSDDSVRQSPEELLAWQAEGIGGGEDFDPTMSPDYDGPDLATVWSMLRAWIDENAPATSREMSSTGATAAEVAAAEATTGLVWTDELRTWFTLHSGVMLSNGSPFLAGYYVPDLGTATASRASALEIQSSAWADPDYGLGDETVDDDRGEAGTGSFGFDPSFVIIGDAHARAEMVVDLRPGPLHGCVMGHEWEDGGATRPDLGWPSIAAMVWDHLEALHGRPSARLLGADPVVTDAGYLDWTFGV